MEDELKMLNVTHIKGRLECANEVWAKCDDKDPYKKELEEEIRILIMLLRYTIPI